LARNRRVLVSISWRAKGAVEVPDDHPCHEADFTAVSVVHMILSQRLDRAIRFGPRQIYMTGAAAAPMFSGFRVATRMTRRLSAAGI
jgi:hypothetical protein